MGGGEQASGVLRWRLGTVAEDRLADIFVMVIAGLDLLRDRVHVAKAAFELVGAEYGGGPRPRGGGIGHRDPRGDRPGRARAEGYRAVVGGIPPPRQNAPRPTCRRPEVGAGPRRTP